MHKEEFYNILIKNKFVSYVLKQIKNIAIKYKIEKILKLIDSFEIDSHNYSMTNFSFLITEILNDFSEKSNEGCGDIQIQTVKTNSIIKNITDSLKLENSSNSINSNKNKIFDNLDELVDYINSNEKPTKKSKNKIKNVKKKSGNNNLSNFKSKPVINEKEFIFENEKLVEKFKKNIYTESIYANSIRKIKPLLTLEWIKTIQNYN